jgi:hypothetical protein
MLKVLKGRNEMGKFIQFGPDTRPPKEKYTDLWQLFLCMTIGAVLVQGIYLTWESSKLASRLASALILILLTLNLYFQFKANREG